MRLTFRLPCPCIRASLLAGLLLAQPPAAAAETPDASREIVDLFVSLCVDNGPESARVEAMAESLGLKAIAAAPGAILVPSGPDRTTRAWRVIGAAGVPYVLSVASGRDATRQVAICVLADSAASAPAVRDNLTARLALGHPFRTEPGDAETVTFWRSNRGGRPMIVSVTVRADGGAGIVLSANVVSPRPKS